MSDDTTAAPDGTTNLGGPVPVTVGIAVGPFTNLPPGPHSITAVFTPTNPTAFQPSTSHTETFTF
ncbi:MAG: Ig-like domain repeat protein [Pseudonocardiaceae bacterium]